MNKICSKCGVLKEDSCFGKCKNVKSGLYPSCKDCRKKYRIDNIDFVKTQNKEYYERVKNSEEFKDKAHKYYLRVKTKKIEYAKSYFKKNKSKVLKRQNDWVKHKKEINPSFRLTQKIRRIIRRTLERKNSRSIEYVGVSNVDEFINLLTNKCENKNWLNDGYHLDHIWQVHWFEEALKENPELISKIIHNHKNLRPIPKIENFNRPKDDFSCLDINDLPIYEPYLNMNILNKINRYFNKIV